MAWARLLLHRPALVAALMLCALAVRLAVPAGFMPVLSGGGVTLQLCPGTMPAPATPEPMAGMHHGGGDRHEAPARAEQPCTFAGLAAAALGSAAPVLLAAALAFAFLLAVRGVPLALPRPAARFRPPLRAPPLTT